MKLIGEREVQVAGDLAFQEEERQGSSWKEQGEENEKRGDWGSHG